MRILKVRDWINKKKTDEAHVQLVNFIIGDDGKTFHGYHTNLPESIETTVTISPDPTIKFVSPKLRERFRDRIKRK